jgi:UDP-N-acetyl-D-mannosaminuronic acid transferase (WecB/TagA/CpsF family)
VPGHVGDMVMLADAHRHAHEAFMKSKCNFVGQKSTKIFSLGSKDQSHKQHNKSLQTHSNALGLCESSDALTLFAFAGPYCELMVED